MGFLLLRYNLLSTLVECQIIRFHTLAEPNLQCQGSQYCVTPSISAFISAHSRHLLLGLVNVQPDSCPKIYRESPHILINTIFPIHTSGQAPPFQCTLLYVLMLYQPKLQFMSPCLNGTKMLCLSATSLFHHWKWSLGRELECSSPCMFTFKRRLQPCTAYCPTPEKRYLKHLFQFHAFHGWSLLLIWITNTLINIIQLFSIYSIS